MTLGIKAKAKTVFARLNSNEKLQAKFQEKRFIGSSITQQQLKQIKGGAEEEIIIEDVNAG